jgi:ethanolamine-phosphate cytidylyltransferase
MLGTYLIVGVNTEETVVREKGAAPILSDAERDSVVRACRFVDQTVPCPYTMDDAFLEQLVAKHKVDFIVHGDDACIGPDGTDVYAEAKKRGMFKTYPRTEGVSTTDILGRTLQLTTQHHIPGPTAPIRLSSSNSMAALGGFSQKAKNLLHEFGRDLRRPRRGETVVYVDGSFDLFHIGHVKTLEHARAHGDYLLVGLHGDSEVRRQKGGIYPILNCEERLLALVGCRHVDDVLVNAPWAASPALLREHGIDIICHGTTSDTGVKEQADPYAEVRSLGVLREVHSGSDLTVEVVLKRLEPARDELQKRYLRKSEAEKAFWRSHQPSH